MRIKFRITDRVLKVRPLRGGRANRDSDPWRSDWRAAASAPMSRCCCKPHQMETKVINADEVKVRPLTDNFPILNESASVIRDHARHQVRPGCSAAAAPAAAGAAVDSLTLHLSDLSQAEPTARSKTVRIYLKRETASELRPSPPTPFACASHGRELLGSNG